MAAPKQQPPSYIHISVPRSFLKELKRGALEADLTLREYVVTVLADHLGMDPKALLDDRSS